MTAHSDAVDVEARELLRDAGLRATQQRLGVMRAFLKAEGHHLSADDVWHHVRARPGGLNRSTAYRAVDSLVGANVLKEVRFHDGVARFEIQRRHHHHAVCTRCGATVDVHHDAMRALARQLQRTEGFVLSDDPQLLAGLCRACAAA